MNPVLARKHQLRVWPKVGSKRAVRAALLVVPPRVDVRLAQFTTEPYPKTRCVSVAGRDESMCGWPVAFNC